MAKTNLSAERVRELLHYDPENGVFTRRVRTSNRINVGDEAGTITTDGYVAIRVDGQKYKGHRLAFLYMTGAWPDGEVDHINGIGHDNRFANLRVTDRLGNTQNVRHARRDNSNGLLGVRETKYGWQARIQVDKRPKVIGTFKTPEEAHAAYLAAKRAMHATCSI